MLRSVIATIISQYDIYEVGKESLQIIIFSIFCIHDICNWLELW